MTAICSELKQIPGHSSFSVVALCGLPVAGECTSTFQSAVHLLQVFGSYEASSLNRELAMGPMPEWLPKLRQLCHEKLGTLPSDDLAARCPSIVRAHREGPAIHEILEYGDGILTQIGTFQEFYTQAVLRDY